MFEANNHLIDANSNAYDHVQDRFDKEYGNGIIENTIHTIEQIMGYNEAAFGNDPLIKAHLYECPKHTSLVWVDSYVKADGTIIEGHFRTPPDHTTSNNLNK